jgi:hypothetical protein
MHMAIAYVEHGQSDIWRYHCVLPSACLGAAAVVLEVVDGGFGQIIMEPSSVRSR